MLEALKEASEHKDEYEAFAASLRSDNPEAVAEWEKLVQEFDQNEGDRERMCPYMVESESTYSIALYCAVHL